MKRNAIVRLDAWHLGAIWDPSEAKATAILSSGSNLKPGGILSQGDLIAVLGREPEFLFGSLGTLGTPGTLGTLGTLGTPALGSAA